jgi:hypothetical protein
LFLDHHHIPVALADFAQCFLIPDMLLQRPSAVGDLSDTNILAMPRGDPAELFGDLETITVADEQDRGRLHISTTAGCHLLTDRLAPRRTAREEKHHRDGQKNLWK